MTEAEAIAYLEETVKKRLTELRRQLTEAEVETTFFFNKKMLQLEGRIKELEAEVKELKP